MSAQKMVSQLRTLNVGSVPSSLIHSITNHIWGGVFDRDGRMWGQMNFILNRTRRIGEDDNWHTRLGDAFAVLDGSINGCNWGWLLRDDEKHGHFANMMKDFEGRGKAYCEAYHKDAAFALIMSLVQAIEIESAANPGKIR